MCEIYILLKLIDCIIRAALNHVNFNPTKMTKLLTTPEKIFQLIIYTLFRSNFTSAPPPVLYCQTSITLILSWQVILQQYLIQKCETSVKILDRKV